MQEYALHVSSEQAGMRLDLFLSGFSKKNNLGLSRTAIQDLISKGKITVKNSPDLNPVRDKTSEMSDGRLRRPVFNGVKPHYKVKAQDAIKVIIDEKIKSILKPEKIPLDVIYEDKDLAIINKPSGLVVHPAPGNYEHTLVNALLSRFKALSDINPQRPGVVHRLDKDTSGILVIAKNNSSHLKLAGQFAEHSIKRKYVAIVKGRMEFDENVIEAPIARHAFKRESMAVNFSDKARYAKTYYRTLKRIGDFSLLQLEPFTGRTHQLRVHLAFIGHPILGDKKYGKNNDFSRLALHAQALGFIHPTTGKFVEFSSSLPQEFLDVTNKK